ncbi:MAG: acyl-CoA dehydrogenase family protein, partial [Nitriliruptorales bacterium]
LDPTRPLADLAFDSAAVASADAGADSGLRRATALLAAELAGVGRGAIDLAVEYAKVREQFGQAIGRFQGVAHQLADAWTAVEESWSLALYAAWAVAAEAADVDQAVHAAKAKAGEAAIHAAERCTQAHGGIGITWEADPHLYLRRALATDGWLGTAREHRRRLGALIVESRSLG